MWETDLIVLEALKQALSRHALDPVTCGDVANAIAIVLRLFILAEHELTNLGECIDNLAKHTGYQLKEKTLNPEG